MGAAGLDSTPRLWSCSSAPRTGKQGFDMAGFFNRKEILFAGLALAMLGGCVSGPRPAPEVAAPDHKQCRAVKADDPSVGNWLSVRSEKGVSGQLYSLFTLKADGT